MVADTVLWASSTWRGPRLPYHMIHQITVIIAEFRSTENAIDEGLLFAPSGVAVGHDVGRKLRVCPKQQCRAGIRKNEPMKRRGTPNESVPRTASRCHRDRLVERLAALHPSIPNAGEPMAKTSFNHSQKAPAIDLVPPTDRRRSRAAELPPRRISPTAGDAASGTRPRPPFECIALLLQGGGALGAHQAGSCARREHHARDDRSLRRAQSFVNGFLSELLTGLELAVRIMSMRARNVAGTRWCPG
jgi:hypothetical protein